MCGIFGYVGNKKASSEILNGLQRLEYRGYDSAGICVVNKKGESTLIKSVGRIVDLKNKVSGFELDNCTTGIGHTRWATHGKVTEQNSHPHYSSDLRFYVVHNGIIENYSTLKKHLEEKGYKFYSQTDTEVAVKLFEDEVKNHNGDKKEALKSAIKKMEGAYAFVILDKDAPDELIGAKLGSPLVLGVGENEIYVSSDYRSLIGISKFYVTLEDGDTFFIKGTNYEILNNGVEIVRNKDEITEDDKNLELGDFPNFMLKEVFEQKDVIKNVFAGKIDFEKKEIRNAMLDELGEKNFEKIVIVASGTSYHSGLMGKYYFEELAGIEVDVVVSTEFKYKRKFVDDKTLFMFISQSGETADTLESLKIVKNQGGYTFGIVNVPGSSIARMSDGGFFTHAGIEVGVASTKAFVTQVATLIVMALYFGIKKGLDYVKYTEMVDELAIIDKKIGKVLDNSSKIKKVAEKYAKYNNFFYLGRTYELPIAMEGSLKLKELTYKHSEAYSSGELKHGPIALIDENLPTIVINGNGPLYTKNLSSIEEIKARSGKIIGVITTEDQNKEKYDDILEFEMSLPEFNPLLEVVVLQLFAYHMTIAIGNDVDKPRNLAKSVTVE
ncbi:MAG: glutamine--fructose-6-phosphate transaminase (isomerizing) [Candidatus Gracilibacteria bacterium]|nr:glutamine--fructose-6-phosphate transaminase (isomerizing) [Candidatus Gracilibacteria bacterium]